jgi:outer membrane protein assembly factor BamB
MAKTLVRDVTLIILAAVITSTDAASTWPQWRGPTRDGKVTGDPWPAHLEKQTLKQLWRVPLDKGYPGPIVSADRVFVAETKDKKYEVVRALDRHTGNEIWQRQWEGTMAVPFFAKKNGSWIRSTPAYDGQSLFVGGMCDVLVALDAETGAVRWQIDFARKYDLPLPGFGLVCSPMVVGDHVYIQAGGAFVRIDKDTGEVQWRTLVDGNGMYGGSFSSPTLARIHGQDTLLVQTRQEITGVRPSDGEVLWRHTVPSFRGMNILTPSVYKNAVFTSTYKNRSFLFSVQKNSDSYAIEQSWDCAVKGYMSSPIVIGQNVYLHLENDRLACLDLETGEQRWRSKKKFGEYCSMAVQGSRILALSCEGDLILFDANPDEFQLLGRQRVSKSPTWGHLAIADDQIFIRELNAVTAWHWQHVKPTN